MQERQRPEQAGRVLHSPDVHYADGTVAAGGELAVDSILEQFQRLDADRRRAFLCRVAHDLTIGIRTLLAERPIADSEVDRVWAINEALHQLTSCANPEGTWSAQAAANMMRAIIDDSFNSGIEKWVGYALAAAAGSTMNHQGFAAAK